MLDENLPTFYIQAANSQSKHLESISLRQYGSEAQPAYSLHHLDPALQTSQNKYGVALYDSYSPDILYAEVLVIPQWTQPSLSQDAIRHNGGVAPPPEPILPLEFTIQLYNPDLQVVVRHKPKTWNSAASWDFEMPQQTFRQPSGSSLDKTMSDPAVSANTPRLKFTWKRDSKLSKDLGCYLSGKTANPDGTKKKSKEPDITVAIFNALKEITLYEPNLYRVEMEDFKGLEVALMLGAAVIRDVYFTPMSQAFNISDPPRPNSVPITSTSPRQSHVPPGGQAVDQSLVNNGIPNGRPITGRPERPKVTIPRRKSLQPPPVDPRTQWQIDAEAAQLRHAVQAGEQERERERQRREQEAERQTRKLMEAEQKAARKKQAEVDRETERLKRFYGTEQQQYVKQHPQASARPALPQRTSQQAFSGPSPQMVSNPLHRRWVSSAVPQPTAQGPYSQAPGGNARLSSVQFQTARPTSMFGLPQQQLKEKRSFFGFRKNGDEGSKVLKKKSTMF